MDEVLSLALEKPLPEPVHADADVLASVPPPGEMTANLPAPQ